MNRFRKLFKIIWVNLLILAVLLLLLELSLRLLYRNDGNSPVNPDPVLNWVHLKNYRYTMFTPSGEFGGFDVYIDSMGRRASLPEKAIPRSSSTAPYVFLGDSFTEALQVPYDSSFIGVLSQQFPNETFLNYGVTGYSPVLYYLNSLQLLHSNMPKPKAAFITLYSNDVREDSTLLSRAEWKEGMISAVNGGEANSWHVLFRKSYLVLLLNRFYKQWNYQRAHPDQGNGVVVNGKLEENPELEGTLTSLYLRKTDSLYKSLNIPLYITAIPSRYREKTGKTDRPYFSTIAREWAQKNNLNFIDLETYFFPAQPPNTKPLFFNVDMHCTAEGQARVANAIGEVLKNKE